jgi:hypothetical protein
MSEPEPSQIDRQLQVIGELEGAIGLPSGFFESLYAEDDWSFVVKLHALIEAAVTHLLVEYLDDPRLLGPLLHLPLSDKSAGKMAFVKALDLVSKPYRSFVAKLSEIRNNLVHNVAQTRFTFTSFTSSLDGKQQHELASALAVGIHTDSGGRTREFLANPKGMIWISALCLLSMLSLSKKLAATEREVKIANKVTEVLGRLGVGSNSEEQEEPGVGTCI